MSTRTHRISNKNNKNNTNKKNNKNNKNNTNKKGGSITSSKIKLKKMLWNGLKNHKEYLTIDKKFWENLTIEKIYNDIKNNDTYVKQLLKSYYKPLVKSITKWRYTKDEKDEINKHNDILFEAIMDKKEEKSMDEKG